MADIYYIDLRISGRNEDFLRKVEENDQIRLLDAYDRLVDAVLGASKWNDTPRAENAVLRSFYEALLTAMADGSRAAISSTCPPGAPSSAASQK